MSTNVSCCYCYESNKTWRENGEDKTNYDYEVAWKNHINCHVPRNERKVWEYVERIRK